MQAGEGGVILALPAGRMPEKAAKCSIIAQLADGVLTYAVVGGGPMDSGRAIEVEVLLAMIEDLQRVSVNLVVGDFCAYRERADKARIGSASIQPCNCLGG